LKNNSINPNPSHNPNRLNYKMTFRDALHSLSARTVNMALAAWFISMLISLSIYIGGVSDQLTFSSGKVW
jgi:hypothetical protein